MEITRTLLIDSMYCVWYGHISRLVTLPCVHVQVCAPVFVECDCCQCERRQQTCEHVARDYTIGKHQPTRPSVTIAFQLCFCTAFVLTGLICDGIYVGKGYKRKTPSCLKEESFTIIYINKKLYFTITITTNNSTYPASFILCNTWTGVHTLPLFWVKCARDAIISLLHFVY